MKILRRIFIPLFSFALFWLPCCHTPATSEDTPVSTSGITRRPALAEVRDAHGCISSAGYVWSAAKDSCIRLWESAAELQPADRSELVIYVVLSNDKRKAEIFIPDDSSFTLQGPGNGTFSADSLTLTVTGDNYALRSNGKIAYQTGAPVPPAQAVRPGNKKRKRR